MKGILNFVGRELAEAKLTIVEPTVEDPDVPFKFNPAEYKLSKENVFAEVPIPGLDTPPLQWVRGGAETLTLDLLVDTSDDVADDELRDVRTRYVDKLRACVSPDEQLHAPPVVDLLWAGQVFHGVISSLQATYVLFHSDGTPLRAKLSLTLKEYRPVEVQTLDMSSPDIDKRYVVRAGETLSGIAGNVYRDPGRWRVLARANGVDPRRLEPGTVLAVPPLPPGPREGR